MGKSNRETEIIKYLQNGMKKYFNDSCQLIQAEIEVHGIDVWNELKSAIDEVLISVRKEQEKNQKNDIQYLAFGFLISSLYMDKLEFRIDAFDDSFYLDKKETASSYIPEFLQSLYQNDLSQLYIEAGRKFVRMQEIEQFSIKKYYACYYEAVIYRMLENLSRLIMQHIVESGIGMTDDFKIICGKFMDKAVVLYTKEKKEHEIFSD